MIKRTAAFEKVLLGNSRIQIPTPSKTTEWITCMRAAVSKMVMLAASSLNFNTCAAKAPSIIANAPDKPDTMKVVRGLIFEP